MTWMVDHNDFLKTFYKIDINNKKNSIKQLNKLMNDLSLAQDLDYHWCNLTTKFSMFKNQIVEYRGEKITYEK